MKIYYLPILLAIVLSSCSKDNLQLLKDVEEVLPGFWQIDSIKLPKDNGGITYQGNTFIADTILFDVGTIEIPKFSSDTLSAYNNLNGKVRCIINIENELLQFNLQNLTTSDDEISMSLEIFLPTGIDTIDTAVEQFVWSSHILSRNYFVRIIDHNTITLDVANTDGEIALRRL